jgi:hypothetical protein
MLLGLFYLILLRRRDIAPAVFIMAVLILLVSDHSLSSSEAQCYLDQGHGVMEQAGGIYGRFLKN